MNNEQKLDPEFKAKWVAALRSGGYKQTRNTIYNAKENSFCCLGVAAMVCGVDLELVHCGGYDELPEVISRGFRNPTAVKLMDMNDSQKKSFSEIADYIEANL
jgi:hypothetical protein